MLRDGKIFSAYWWMVPFLSFMVTCSLKISKMGPYHPLPPQNFSGKRASEWLLFSQAPSAKTKFLTVCTMCRSQRNLVQRLWFRAWITMRKPTLAICSLMVKIKDIRIWELLWGLLMPVWGHRCPGLALFPCDGGGRCSPVALPIALIAFLDHRCLLW